MSKVPDHVGFVLQQSTDKIGDSSIDNRRFCPEVCTKPKRRNLGIFSCKNWKQVAAKISKTRFWDNYLPTLDIINFQQQLDSFCQQSPGVVSYYLRGGFAGSPVISTISHVNIKELLFLFLFFAQMEGNVFISQIKRSVPNTISSISRHLLITLSSNYTLIIVLKYFHISGLRPAARLAVPTELSLLPPLRRKYEN